MLEILKSDIFDAWMRGLKDHQARARIEMRIRRLSLGNPGQYRHLVQGVCEMKIDYGPGYRVYYTLRGKVLAILLCGGDKSSQQEDIATAIRVAATWKD